MQTTWNPAWEQIFRDRQWGKYPPEHLIRFVARNFYKSPDRSQIQLLEVGCGPGSNIWFMAREGFSVAGIDGSETAIRIAKERLTNEELDADLRVGDFVKLPWADATFDGVVENVSLSCNPRANIQLAIAEIHRVLKPGASVLSSFFSNRTWGYGQGQMTEPGGFANINEGPLAGAGFCLFLTRNELPELYRNFVDVTVERISWTLEKEQHLVEQFVITCRKPNSP
jgi:ubiquinone/menaquinone biosynthesis C-methylase UbiE